MYPLAWRKSLMSTCWVFIHASVWPLEMCLSSVSGFLRLWLLLCSTSQNSLITGIFCFGQFFILQDLHFLSCLTSAYVLVSPLFTQVNSDFPRALSISVLVFIFIYLSCVYLCVHATYGQEYLWRPRKGVGSPRAVVMVVVTCLVVSARNILYPSLQLLGLLFLINS